jgi:Uma2 family endonuclease
MGAKILMTAEEFDRLEESDEFRYELDEAELIVMTRPRPLHNRIALKLTSALVRYVEEHSVGEVLNSDNMYVLGPTTRRAPDVSFLRKERAASIDPTKDIEGAPDLAVEVVSPTDTAASMRRKVRQYFAAGAAVVWVVYPESREVEIWEESQKPARVLQEDAVLEEARLLPGFSLRISRLFE